MKVQVLVATMNQKDKSLLKKMNIQSDAIIGNQCDNNQIDKFNWNGHEITYINSSGRGLSMNRNNALIIADADICLLADDDMVYEDGYVETVVKMFQQIPDADVLIFNIKEPMPTRYVIKKTTRVCFLNYLRYGSVRIAFKLKSIQRNAIFFNQYFGAGTDRQFGEDNLFLTSCLKNKLKIYAIPVYIARLTEERASTWFNGYDEQYLHNKGLLFRTISAKWCKILCFQDALRHHKEYNSSFVKAYKILTCKNDDIGG